MFSLRNNDDLPPFKAPLKDENDVKAMYRFVSQGPVFGAGHDFHATVNTRTTTSSRTNFGSSYKLPAGYTYHSGGALLAGSRFFALSEVEVLYLN